jgi:hypothetical protein
MNYKLVKGPDNITWVSIEPLRDDVLDSLVKLEQVNIEGLSTIDKDIMNFNILGMKAIATFLNSLVQESDNDETINRPTTH